MVFYIVLQTTDKGYRRLTPDQSVGLRHAGYVITVEEVKSVSEEFFTLSLPIKQTRTLIKFKEKTL